MNEGNKTYKNVCQLELENLITVFTQTEDDLFFLIIGHLKYEGVIL